MDPRARGEVPFLSGADEGRGETSAPEPARTQAVDLRAQAQAKRRVQARRGRDAETGAFRKAVQALLVAWYEEDPEGTRKEQRTRFGVHERDGEDRCRVRAQGLSPEDSVRKAWERGWSLFAANKCRARSAFKTEYGHWKNAVIGDRFDEWREWKGV